MFSMCDPWSVCMCCVSLCVAYLYVWHICSVLCCILDIYAMCYLCDMGMKYDIRAWHVIHVTHVVYI